MYSSVFILGFLLWRRIRNLRVVYTIQKCQHIGRIVDSFVCFYLDSCVRLQAILPHRNELDAMGIKLLAQGNNSSRNPQPGWNLTIIRPVCMVIITITNRILANM